MLQPLRRRARHSSEIRRLLIPKQWAHCYPVVAGLQVWPSALCATVANAWALNEPGPFLGVLVRCNQAIISTVRYGTKTGPDE
jgi:hypothetical protein